MHGIDQADALPDSAFSDQFFDGMGDIDEPPAIRHLEPKMFGE